MFSFSYTNYKHKKLIKEEYNKFYESFNIVYEDVYGSAWILDSNIGFPQKLKQN